MWMLRTSLLTLLTLLLLTTNALAQGTIFVVRHAERADGGMAAKTTDPSLSGAGHARAASLVTVLKDTGIREIFVTEYKRTQESAAPLAKALDLVPTTVAAKDIPGLVARLTKITGHALVVGHSNSIPEILRALGVTPAPTIGDDDYDDLFIVVPGQPTRMIHLHYR